MRDSILYLTLILIAYGIICCLRLEYVMTMENIGVMYGDVIKSSNVTAASLYEQTHKYWVTGLLLALIPAICKVFFYALVVYIGFYLISKQKYLEILKATVVAEFVNVLMGTTKTIDMIFFNPPTTLVDMSLAPLSLASLFDVHKLDQWMLVPLSAANVFEVLYMLVLSYLLSRNLKQGFGRCLKVVVSSYGLVSVLIVVVMTFITVYATR